MPDIHHDFPIHATLERVFQAISAPEGLDSWWTKQSSGKAQLGAEYTLSFGPGYDWRARVSRCSPCSEFELELTESDEDWQGTRVGFELETRGTLTWLRFHHTGWRQANEHYRITSNCWALYLRILRRALEHGESVPYEARLDV